MARFLLPYTHEPRQVDMCAFTLKNVPNVEEYEKEHTKVEDLIWCQKFMKLARGGIHVWTYSLHVFQGK